MTHALVIAVFVVAFAAEGIAPADGIAHGWHLAWIAGVYLLVWGIGSARVSWCVRRFETTRRGRWIARAERAGAMTRLAAVAWHGVGVLLLGTLSGWREAMGPVPLLGDAVVVAQPFVVFVGVLWALSPIERSIRRAMQVRAAAAGEPIGEVLSRGSYVAAGVRQQIGFIAVPIGLIYVWGWFVSWAWARWGLPMAGTLDAAAHFAGAIGMFVLVPPVMRRVLNTRPIERGDMRDALIELGRSHGVRFREVLVWRTGGSQVNGAVMGLFAPMRYVMLTDGLLTSLPAREIEGVMAHEVAHVRRRHILWMGLTVIAAVSLVGTPAGWVAALGAAWFGAMGIAEGIGVAVTLGAALAALGFVSQRFEWQADAFAAKHLAGWRGRGPVEIAPEAALTMVSALRRVASLNGIDPRARDWRHGSIAVRTARLRALAGRRSDRVAIDRETVWIKVAIGVALVIGAGFVLVEAVVGVSGLIGLG